VGRGVSLLPTLRVLDLYSCQGGTTKGFQDAGFRVSGVDIVNQPRYCGDDFLQADALEFLDTHREWIRDNVCLVSAAPPCQGYSATQRIQKNDHPKLIGQTRTLLIEIGVPYVIENVEEAASELRNPVMLCGAMFGLRTRRHRLFETEGWSFIPPEHPAHTEPTVKMGRPLKEGDWYHAVGNFSNVPYVRKDMGMPWASREGIREAIPPAYSKYIGERFLTHLRKVAAA
jgi:DNA (cytosine-5)-methyltransferase 1